MVDQSTPQVRTNPLAPLTKPLERAAPEVAPALAEKEGETRVESPVTIPKCPCAESSSAAVVPIFRTILREVAEVALAFLSAEVVGVEEEDRMA